jgi:endogenous inhibitor of DNA gyrase (YacG/DUF329 family)
MIRVRCPICDQLMQGASTAEWPHFPFCSERCRLVDLGRWLGEAYTIRPTAEEEDQVLSDDKSRTP